MFICLNKKQISSISFFVHEATKNLAMESDKKFISSPLIHHYTGFVANFVKHKKILLIFQKICIIYYVKILKRT